MSSGGGEGEGRCRGPQQDTTAPSPSPSAGRQDGHCLVKPFAISFQDSNVVADLSSRFFFPFGWELYNGIAGIAFLFFFSLDK